MPNGVTQKSIKNVEILLILEEAFTYTALLLSSLILFFFAAVVSLTETMDDTLPLSSYLSKHDLKSQATHFPVSCVFIIGFSWFHVCLDMLCAYILIIIWEDGIHKRSATAVVSSPSSLIFFLFQERVCLQEYQNAKCAWNTTEDLNVFTNVMTGMHYESASWASKFEKSCLCVSLWSNVAIYMHETIVYINSLCRRRIHSEVSKSTLPFATVNIVIIKRDFAKRTFEFICYFRSR